MDNIFSYNDIQKKKFLKKMIKYCAYQERCHQDVKNKLSDLGVEQDIADEIISELITSKYLNEERYVRSYTMGKFRINKWGKNKIKIALKQKDISSYLIEKYLREIDYNKYIETLKILLDRKSNSLKSKNQHDKYNKLYRYAYNKGYESEVIKEILQE